MKELGCDSLEMFQLLKMANNAKIKKCLPHNLRALHGKHEDEEDIAKGVAKKPFVRPQTALYLRGLFSHTEIPLKSLCMCLTDAHN